MFKTALLAISLLGASLAVHADAELQQFVQQTLSAARDKASLPAVATLVSINGKIEAQAAVGLRAVGRPQPVTIDDRWHLGSDSKAMTATLIARLVEQGLLDYDDTMDKIFPGIAARMHPALHDVTVAQLLSHTSGLAPLVSDAEMATFQAVISAERGLRAQRAALVVHYLSHAPATKAGEFSYSNLGYAIVGAIAEERTGESWEDLIRNEVWKPLGIKNAGFGPPGKSGRYNQPLGHEFKDGKAIPRDPGEPGSDNPPAIGPAGTINISLKDWLLFAQDHLDGERGHGKLLKPESYKKLHTAVSKNYAMGWGVLREADGSISMLTHTGSNGYWVADIRIYPKHDIIVLTALNAGGKPAEIADREIGVTLRERLKPID